MKKTQSISMEQLSAEMMRERLVEMERRQEHLTSVQFATGKSIEFPPSDLIGDSFDNRAHQIMMHHLMLGDDDSALKVLKHYFELAFNESVDFLLKQMEDLDNE